jgi:TrmH family RNA methyltransferase
MGERIRNELFETKSRPLGAAGSELLTSRDNKWLKEFRAALRGGVPTEAGAVGVEGLRLVEEALESGGKIEAVLFSESGERHRERLAPMISRRELGFPVLRTTDRLFEGIGDTEHPQGVAALVVPRQWEIADVIRGSEGTFAPLLVVMAGVQDPGNVGAILRTAAAFEATGVITAATGQSGTASPFTPKAMRASAGAALHLPIVSGMALGILLTHLKLNGIRTVATCVQENRSVDAKGKGAGIKGSATSSRAALAPWEMNWCEASALLVGNEGAGLPEDVVRSADLCVNIPLSTVVESLNAAAATAVLLYEAYRQRKNRKVEG